MGRIIFSRHCKLCQFWGSVMDQPLIQLLNLGKSFPGLNNPLKPWKAFQYAQWFRAIKIPASFNNNF
jgi:hypothetical protein